MSDSANGDNDNWPWAAGTAGSSAGANTDTQDDDPLPFAAPGSMPVLPRYGVSNGVSDGGSAVSGVNSANSSLPSTMEPASQAPPTSAVSDLPTARVSVAPAPTPAAPSVSDLPTTRMPSADGASAPPDVSALPTQRVKAATLPAAPSVEESPAAPTTLPSTERKRPRGAVVLVAAIVMLLLASVSAALLALALRPGTVASTSSVAYHQTLTAPTQGWPNSGACQFTPTGYEVSGPSVCFYDGQDVRDATVSVTMTRASGGNDPSAGIAFRRAGPGAFYTFEIDGNGDWAVYKRGTVLQQGVSVAIKTDAGAKNTLQAQMKGGHFTFSINGKRVAQADDAEFAAGAVGLTGYTGLKVVYTDFTIAPL
jgi:hypothetical protein